MTVFYIAATDKMSWGRGTKPWEAIGHSIDHGPQAGKIILFEVKAPDGTKEADIYVNEMGSIVAPAGTEVKELVVIDSGVFSGFLNYKEEVERWLE